jgi:hypothetical protein
MRSYDCPVWNIESGWDSWADAAGANMNDNLFWIAFANYGRSSSKTDFKAFALGPADLKRRPDLPIAARLIQQSPRQPDAVSRCPPYYPVTI